ncbi:hypothetical protein [Planctomicrobium sp. SH664]|uniref:hypothetical protein n=1 Tax=Planctomicrobium sp. SH664 TaxID=3448125 RepID=UPI003F5B8712
MESTLLLKACGFIEAHRARIIDVTEQQLHVRIGQNWLTRWLKGCHTALPLDVVLNFRSVRDCEEFDRNRYRRPVDSYLAIDVAIHPASPAWDDQRFQEHARQLVWVIRSHFMAC